MGRSFPIYFPTKHLSRNKLEFDQSFLEIKKSQFSITQSPMRINSPFIPLLAGCLLMISCSPAKEIAEKKHPESFSELSAHTQEEPDLTAFLDLFSEEEKVQEPGNEEIERNFVEGCTQMMRGNLDEALNYFQKVLDADPNNSPALYNSARIYHEQKDYTKAVELAQQALSGEGDNYWYHKFLVRALGSKGDIRRAISTQKGMVERFPEKISDKIDLTDLLIKNGQKNEALKMLDKIEEEKGVSRMISLRKFELQKASGDHEDALESIQTLIKSGETSPSIYHRQFETLNKLGRSQEAAQSLEAILDIDADNEYALLTLADYYKRQNQIEKSDAYLFRAFANVNINPQGKIRIIEQLIPFAQVGSPVKDRLDKLVDLFNKAHPNVPENLILKGMLGQNSAGESANLDNYRKALEQNPQQTDLWLALLNESYTNKDFQQLSKDAELALEYYPNQSQFLYYYGKSSAILEDYSAATYSFNKLKKIAANDQLLSAQASLELGNIYKKQEQADKAKQNLDEANKLLLEAKDLSPENPRVYELLGDYYALLGVPDLSEQQWKTSIEKGAKFTIEEKMKEFGYKNE